MISRYSGVDGYDWLAIPLLPYLYAVNRADEIPASIDARGVAQLRDQYRRAHLERFVPDGPDGTMPPGEWTELIGASYSRKMYVFEMESSTVQDDQLIEILNTRPNKRRFNFLFRNCADFSRSILNLYYPHAVHRSFTADIGLTTPKQIAKSFVSYAHHHQDLQFSTFMIPQVPGQLDRSDKARGVVESLVKSKQYVVPLVVWQPVLTIALMGTYLTRGRFDPSKDAVALDSGDEVPALLQDDVPRANPKVGSGLLRRTSLNATVSSEDYQSSADVNR
ncbi:MAG TPA: hypothetical protein VHX63_14210 [Acidobacteriaceae bacterium]|nr:hypothetical protein [Acidobacteriaceae bacterium]